MTRPWRDVSLLPCDASINLGCHGVDKQDGRALEVPAVFEGCRLLPGVWRAGGGRLGLRAACNAEATRARGWCAWVLQVRHGPLRLARPSRRAAAASTQPEAATTRRLGLAYPATMRPGVPGRENCDSDNAAAVTGTVPPPPSGPRLASAHSFAHGHGGPSRARSPSPGMGIVSSHGQLRGGTTGAARSALS